MPFTRDDLIPREREVIDYSMFLLDNCEKIHHKEEHVPGLIPWMDFFGENSRTRQKKLCWLCVPVCGMDFWRLTQGNSIIIITTAQRPRLELGAI